MQFKMPQAQTGQVQVDAKSSYRHSFGGLPTETTYVNGFKDLDSREDLNDTFQKGFKALTTTTGGSGSTDQTMVPIYVDQRVVDTTRKYTPLVELVPRVTNQGITADYNRVTSKGSAVTAAEDAALDDQNDNTERKSKSIKYIYAVGRVTGQAQASYPNYMLEGFNPSGTGLGQSNPFSDAGAPNAKQLKVLMKTRAIREKEEDLIINGDSSSDSTEFDGIVQQQSGTNQIDASTSALSYDHIEKAVRTAYDNSGRPNLAVAASDALKDIRKIMIDTFNYRPQDMTEGAELPFGVSPRVVLETMVGPIPVIPSQQLTNTSGSKQIYFLDMDYIEMRVLQDLTYEDLAKTNDSQKFMLKIYETLVVRAPEFNAYIDNIA